MGNLWIAHFDSSSSSPSSTRPSSPGLTKSTNNEGTHSGTGRDEVSPNGQILPITPTLKIFSFAELKKATRNFRPDAVVGEGCFGTVFKGWIDEKTFAPTKAWSGMAIAVKKLNSDGLQGRKEWQSEVNILGSLSHPNIVRLLGLCEEDKELLVYEFIPSGSLANHLFSRGSAFQTLSWSIRLKIAIGVARGLAFLHCSERKIIHRNLTPSNVLIDSNYNAKISDFRLARDGPPLGGNSHVTIRVMGTYGYLAPEYVATAISKNNSNEGTHSGCTSAFSSSMNEVSPKIFSFAELKKATRKFSPDTLLGEGGFGQVFKGWIDEKTFAQTKAGSGMAIAVKKLSPEVFQGKEEWQSEVNILGSFSHPNVVRLLGRCEEDKELLLVYEFMPRGSLENHLFRTSGAFLGGSFSSKLCETFGILLGRQRIATCMPRGDLANHLFRRSSDFQPLSWSIRLKIAIGAAQGLAFLHTSERPIIYRDVKTSNILLDLNYNAKISDFGLAMSGPYESSYVSTCVLGTYGYAAPEYVATGHLYVKSDVYGFGVVLLEMLSGLRVFDKNRPSGKQNLVEWARPYLSDQRKLLSWVMDKRLEGQYPSEGAVQAAQLILRCLVSQPRKRPSMTEVVETLEQIQAIKQMPEEPKTNPVHLADHNYFDHHAQNHSPLHPKVGNVGTGKNDHYKDGCLW